MSIALNAYQIHREYDMWIVVFATSPKAARAEYEAERGPLPDDVIVTEVPGSRRIFMAWERGTPGDADVPEGGTVESDQDRPGCLMVIATAAQWVAHAARRGRTFVLFYPPPYVER